MKHPVKRTGSDGVYMYRGVRIERDDRSRGYWGHWSARTGGKRLTTENRSQLLAQIDELLDKPAEEQTERNARSIVAVPDLTAELELIRQCLRSGVKQHQISRSVAADIAGSLMRAHAAIVKAIGD